MELTSLEEDIGLGGLHNAIVVSANIWDKNYKLHQVDKVTTVRRLHGSMMKSSGRYSTERTLQMLAENDPNQLDALCYRAKCSDSKGLAIGEKNACHLGVRKC